MMEAALNQEILNDPVTQHLRKDYTSIRIDQTVGEALAAVRERQPEGRIIYFYVVNDAGRLKGVVPTRRLLLNPPETPVADVMVKHVIAIPATATVLDACEFFLLHKFLAFPIVDEEKRLIGIIDVDLYTEELRDIDRREGNDDLFQLIGVHLTDAQQANPVAAFRQRFPWLLCNVVGGIAAAFLSGIYATELQRAVALALFIPVVLALSESVSIQSVSLALQRLRGQRPTWATLLPKVRAELLTGVFLGAACALLVGLVALVWLGEWVVVWCLLGGIGGGVTGAAVLGLSIPYLLHILQRDPQVAAGPIALATTDMVTLLAYYNLARWLLG